MGKRLIGGSVYTTCHAQMAAVELAASTRKWQTEATSVVGLGAGLSGVLDTVIVGVPKHCRATEVAIHHHARERCAWNDWR